MEALLKELNEPLKLNSKLYIKLSKLVPLESSRSKSKGFENGTNAFKILQHITKETIPKFRPLIEESKENSTQPLQVLVKMLVKVVSCLEANVTLLKMQPLDFEKMISNLINRIIDVQCYSFALDLVAFLQSRLIVTKLGFQSSKTDFTSMIDSRKKIFKDEALIIEFKAVEALGFIFRGDLNSAAKVAVIVTLMINALRCWMESGIIKMSEKVNSFYFMRRTFQNR
jgi:hypothetical protein